jgi:hypothetical protein
MTSEEKVKQVYSLAYCGYGGGAKAIFDGLKQISAAQIHRSWAWADAWRRIAAARMAEKGK